jgi:tRNA(Ile2) C34 agmatinyltransferase TiaS
MTVTDQTVLCECCGGRLALVFYFLGRAMFRCRDCGHDQGC